MIVGRGGDSLVLKICSADKQFQAIKQELDPDRYHELNLLQSEARANEVAVRTRWLFNGIHLFMLETLAGGNKSLLSNVLLVSDGIGLVVSRKEIWSPCRKNQGTSAFTLWRRMQLRR